MKIEFYAKEKGLKFTDPMRAYLLEKLDKLSNYIEEINGRAVLKKEGYLLKLEITLGKKLRSSASDEDYYNLVIKVVDQLESQIKKYKRLKRNKEHDAEKVYKEIFQFTPYQTETDIDTYEIIEKQTFVETIYKEEAIETMELLGHSFFAFKDKETNNNCVMYKRFDGNYGCLILL